MEIFTGHKANKAYLWQLPNLQITDNRTLSPFGNVRKPYNHSLQVLIGSLSLQLLRHSQQVVWSGHVATTVEWWVYDER